MQTRILPALAVIVAGALWAISWGFNGQTAEGDGLVLGLSEGGWRAVLNPALAIIALTAIRMARLVSGPAGVTAVAGIGAMLIGNVLEFGLVGRPTPLAELGSSLFLAGAVTAIGALGMGVAQGARAATGRRVLAVSLGIGAALGVALMSVAVPPAAGLALLPLADLLIRVPVTDEDAFAGAATPASATSSRSMIAA